MNNIIFHHTRIDDDATYNPGLPPQGFRVRLIVFGPNLKFYFAKVVGLGVESGIIVSSPELAIQLVLGNDCQATVAGAFITQSIPLSPMVSCLPYPQVLELQHVCNLPCLEQLLLSGNPVTNVVDYRTKVLELFEDRFTELSLDGHKASEKEKVCTVYPLKCLRWLKLPNFKLDCNQTLHEF